MRSARTALITGGSRGIGADTAIAFAEQGIDVAIPYRNKAARADAIDASIVAAWRDGLDLLVLNASGGMERDLVRANPNYPMVSNHDAQLAILDHALPLLRSASTVIFVTSHWAHRPETSRVQSPARDVVLPSRQPRSIIPNGVVRTRSRPKQRSLDPEVSRGKPPNPNGPTHRENPHQSHATTILLHLIAPCA